MHELPDLLQIIWNYHYFFFYKKNACSKINKYIFMWRNTIRDIILIDITSFLGGEMA